MSTRIRLDITDTQPIELPIRVIKINPDIKARGPAGPVGPTGMDPAVYDPQNIEADAFARANHTGTQTMSTISDAGELATQDDNDILAKVYPVGSIYIATVATNPATLLGFGTWSAYGEGRVIVGKAGSGTFGTAGATGGAETHTLTIDEMPSHDHGISSGTLNSASGGDRQSPGTADGDLTTTTGGGNAHNNLQPYIVAYMWERTA